MIKVIMMCGICGSGKTTYAKQKEKEGYVRLSIDEEMWKTYGRKGIDYPNEQYEKLSEIVEMALQKELLSLIQQGKQVVLDFSFWNKANRAYYKRLIEKAGGTPELVYMKASKGTLQKRLDKRNQSLNANSPFIITNEILEHHYNDLHYFAKSVVGEKKKRMPGKSINQRKTRQYRAYQNREKFMIRVLFICHCNV